MQGDTRKKLLWVSAALSSCGSPFQQQLLLKQGDLLKVRSCHKDLPGYAIESWLTLRTKTKGFSVGDIAAKRF